MVGLHSNSMDMKGLNIDSGVIAGQKQCGTMSCRSDMTETNE